MEEKMFEGLTYLVSYPEGFEQGKKYPLVLFLHGAGSRSKSTEILRNNVCLTNLLDRQNKKGYILLAPLCPNTTWDERMMLLIRLLDSFRALPYVDTTRIHITGVSMGGYATWSFCILRPDWFASAMPLCGGGSCGFAKRLVGIPIRAFHGLRDRTVYPVESLEMVRRVNLAGGYAELILFPECEHNIWEKVYGNEENYDWLLSFTNEREKTQEESLRGNYYG